MAQPPKGGLVRGYDKPTHGSEPPSTFQGGGHISSTVCSSQFEFGDFFQKDVVRFLLLHDLHDLYLC